MRLNLIYARAANGVIGKDNAMPWHLPEDLAHFRRYTQGCPVIMGRKTWESLPQKFRPLPGRLNIVLTHDAATAARLQAEGALALASLEQAIAHCATLPAQPDELWVMGGAQIYAQALPLADSIEVTEIGRDYEGDAFAPTLGPEWQEVSRSSHVSAGGLPYHFVRLQRA